MTQIITATSDEDIKAALRGEDTAPEAAPDRAESTTMWHPDAPPEGPEAVPPADDFVPWADMDGVQRYKHVSGMVDEALAGAGSNNPGMWVWSPPGETDAVRSRWDEIMGSRLWDSGSPVPEDSPFRRLYYPEIKEHADCRLPNVLTFEKKLDHDLSEYVLGVGAFAGVDVENIHNAINIDLPTKKAFYLMMELGTPAIERSMRDKAQTAMQDMQAAAQAGRKIIAPPKRGLINPNR